MIFILYVRLEPENSGVQLPKRTKTDFKSQRFWSWVKHQIIIGKSLSKEDCGKHVVPAYITGFLTHKLPFVHIPPGFSIMSTNIMTYTHI